MVFPEFFQVRMDMFGDIDLNAYLVLSPNGEDSGVRIRRNPRRTEPPADPSLCKKFKSIGAIVFEICERTDR